MILYGAVVDDVHLPLNLSRRFPSKLDILLLGKQIPTRLYLTRAGGIRTA